MFHCLTKIRFKCQVFIRHENEACCTRLFHLVLHPALYPGVLTHLDYTHPLLCSLASNWASQELEGRRRMRWKDLFIPVSPCQIAAGWLCLLIKGHSPSQRSPLHTQLSLGSVLLQPSPFRSRSSGDPGCYQPPGPALSFWFPYSLPKSS